MASTWIFAMEEWISDYEVVIAVEGPTTSGEEMLVVVDAREQCRFGGMWACGPVGDHYQLGQFEMGLVRPIFEELTQGGNCRRFGPRETNM